MTKAIEQSGGMSRNATIKRHSKELALELLMIGHSDSDVAKAINMRRETIWRWKHRDPEFQEALRERQSMVRSTAAQRLQGLVDRAVTVVQDSLASPDADPRLALALLGSLGVLDRSRELGKEIDESRTSAGNDVVVERVFAVVDEGRGRKELAPGVGSG